MSTLRGGPNVVTNGLLLYMDAANSRCYPGTGTVWTDLSGNNNSGTLMAPITYSTAPSRFETNATAPADFNQILCANTLTFSDTSEYSFDFFIKMRAGWFAGSIFNMLTGLFAGTPFVAIRPSTGIIWNIWWRQASGVYVVGANVTNIDLANTWVHISLVINSSRVVSAYLNGTLLQTFTLATSAFQINRIASAYNASDGNYYTLQGAIATSKIYNRALSSSEVLNNFNALRGRFGI